MKFPISDFVKTSPTILWFRAIETVMRFWPLELAAKKTGVIYPTTLPETRSPFTSWIRGDIIDRYIYDEVKKLRFGKYPRDKR